LRFYKLVFAAEMKTLNNFNNKKAKVRINVD